MGPKRKGPMNNPCYFNGKNDGTHKYRWYVWHILAAAFTGLAMEKLILGDIMNVWEVSPWFGLFQYQISKKKLYLYVPKIGHLTYIYGSIWAFFTDFPIFMGPKNGTFGKKSRKIQNQNSKWAHLKSKTGGGKAL